MFKDYRDEVGKKADKHFKATLFRSERLMIGLNCLEPGQTQAAHTHGDADKVYYVIEGRGVITIGGEAREVGPGMVAWAPAGVAHGVENRGAARLTLLVSMAPAPK